MSFADLSPEARDRYNANRRERWRTDPAYRAKRIAATRRAYFKRGRSNPETETAKANRAYIREMKMSTPCLDCGVIYPWYVMEFDHVRGQKIATIGSMCPGNREKMLLEIAKCDIVCSNCHAIRTHERGQYLSVNKRKPEKKVVEAVQ